MAENVKWWTGGVLDGDGCVLVRREGTVVVSVKQALKGIGLLEELQAAYGGAIYPAGRVVGARQQAFQWRLAGEKAKAFAREIAPYCRLKRRQFEIAASVPANPKGLDDIRDLQEAARLEIQTLKRTPHEPIEDDPPLAYAAGMVDTDGSLDLIPTARILVIQKHPAIVEYFHRVFGGINYAYANRPAHEWRITGARARQVLERLAPLMRAKHDQALLVLGNDPDAPAQLKALKGNQNKKTHI